MISYIKGKVEFISDSYIVLENNGIGYRIFVSNSTIGRLGKDTEKIYTYMNVKEDGVSLFGFLSIEEINMFNMLIGVSGVGPKVALGILDKFNPDSVMLAIISEDLDTLGKCPGIGKKTSQRIILELKDKIQNTSVLNTDRQERLSLSDNKDSKQEAIEALMALGYKKNESLKAVLEVALPEMKTEQIIKLALKKLSS